MRIIIGLEQVWLAQPGWAAKALKSWWPGTELNRRRQPFQSVAFPHFQQLAGRGRLRKSFQVRAWCINE